MGPLCFDLDRDELRQGDVLVRLIPARSEVPLGVVTGLIGAPIFLYLLVRDRRGACCLLRSESAELILQL